MYTFLKQGCVLPSVTALQILLNRTRPQNRIQVDGVFGPETRNAVVEFQRMKRVNPDGVVGTITWPLLTGKSQLKIIDWVDNSDPDTMLEVIGNLMAAGGDPLVEGGMCGGVSVLVSRVVARAAQSGATVLLRITGHGSGGGQYVTGGRLVWVSKKIPDITIDKDVMKDGAGKPVAWRSAKDDYRYWRDKDGRIIAYSVGLGSEVTLQAMELKKNLWVVSPHNPDDVRGVEPVLGGLRDIFVGFGSVELHGCSVGSGSRGQMLLGMLTRLLGVPVSAALRTQYGQADFPFRFQGPVRTAVPFGGDLTGWSRTVAARER